MQPSVARIDEALCVGCARCLPACPVDAIIGSRNFTHTIINDECVGCGLCLPPCPVDCIDIEPRFPGAPADDEDEGIRRGKLRRLGQTAQRRFRARKARLAAMGDSAEARVSGAPPATAATPTDDEIEDLIRSLS
ncbi:MAG: RnfABCDGE type electron transport complex subunit B [Gammaproteobacteria bacterium]|nr:RnfABCDGE type electron transport complex subunit B [Gammaproteobacteria bacterium]MXW45456.1 RnfABCDGE type electron transport complex subunit B [Gammaproteobacteria bacterium]MYD02229.1 RnfABCDGE type electron transport complex subunit B [Gammaproteobacteria bacterium]MYI25082.1 RnfABCDGE type electron transport complex subunit B [Gammaproteobacteria bacterium]